MAEEKKDAGNKKIKKVKKDDSSVVKKKEENKKTKKSVSATADKKIKVETKNVSFPEQVKPIKTKNSSSSVDNSLQKDEKSVKTDSLKNENNHMSPQNSDNTSSTQGQNGSLGDNSAGQLPSWLQAVDTKNVSSSKEVKSVESKPEELKPEESKSEQVKSEESKPNESVSWPVAPNKKDEPEIKEKKEEVQLPSWLKGGMESVDTKNVSSSEPVKPVDTKNVLSSEQVKPETLKSEDSHNLPSWLKVTPNNGDNQTPISAEPLVAKTADQTTPVQPATQIPTKPIVSTSVQPVAPIPVQPVASTSVQPFAQPTQFPVKPSTTPNSTTPQKPYKPMTLADLAKQTPIFGVEDLDFSKKRRREMREKKKQEENIKEEKKEVETKDFSSPVKETNFSFPVKETNFSSPVKETNFSFPTKETNFPPSEKIKESEPKKEEQKKTEAVDAEVIQNGGKKFQEKVELKEDVETSAFQELKEKISKILEESNISKGQVLGCIGGFFAIIILIILIVAGIKWIFSGIANDIQKPEIIKEEEPKTQPKETTQVPENQVENTEDEFSFVDGTLYAGITAAKFEIKAPSRVNIEDSLYTGLIAGYSKDLTQISFMEESINYLDAMKKIYQVDIRIELKNSKNPQKDLNAYVKDLEEAISKAEDYYVRVQDLRSNLKIDYENATKEKDQYEGFFFENLQNLSSNETEDNLDKFIQAKIDQVDLKAQYKAWGSLEEFYAKYIPIFKTRLKNIQYNEDALLKGVQVYELENSAGLDLIIKVQEKAL